MMFFQLSSSHGFDYTGGIWVVNVQSQKLSTLTNLITVISGIWDVTCVVTVTGKRKCLETLFVGR